MKHRRFSKEGRFLLQFHGDAAVCPIEQRAQAPFATRRLEPAPTWSSWRPAVSSIPRYRAMLAFTCSFRRRIATTISAASFGHFGRNWSSCKPSVPKWWSPRRSSRALQGTSPHFAPTRAVGPRFPRTGYALGRRAIYPSTRPKLGSVKRGGFVSGSDAKEAVAIIRFGEFCRYLEPRRQP
jgi:hypothetical protein